jgi:hypothetical protein
VFFLMRVSAQCAAMGALIQKHRIWTRFSRARDGRCAAKKRPCAFNCQRAPQMQRVRKMRR